MEYQSFQGITKVLKYFKGFQENIMDFYGLVQIAMSFS